MTTNKTKADLETENAELAKKIADYQAELERMRQAYADDSTDQPSHEGVILAEDPFDNHNAFKIHGEIEPCDEYPNGAVIQWKNPMYRERRTWRGWEPFEWGDEYTGQNGELLSKYIPDPPQALRGPDRIDNYVRRGDVVLARLDKNIFLARQEKRFRDSQARSGKATSDKRTVLADGVEIYGPGATDSRRPSGGFRPEREQVNRPKATVLADGNEREV